MGFPETFKALADPARREILMMLRNGRMSAGDISERFDMTGATVSYHLKQLKKAELVYETREKNFIYYTLNTSVFEEIMMWAAQFANISGEKEEQHDEEDQTD
ncbi:Helix-turn-helix domain-containing protein [Ruminococcus sp. YE71]|uniref:autorepressor SdpR family transcription factor n=1 Tax=unclassified Ruminococcus TaxID=2608920 RepID=UPI0008924520|nr:MULTISPECIES: autorepressor SdpR family transcription factor [unclassified Ruminococcus]SDA22163.1 Helix-turn-helix domain-containing protein [Ruminococcus sp. YE78]SFW37567.1 Helix-turn-helix domain-containing protein [Ruminococcus sp. YE71]